MKPSKNIKKIKITASCHDTNWYHGLVGKILYTDLNLSFELVGQYLITNEEGEIKEDFKSVHKIDVEVLNEFHYNCVCCGTEIKTLYAECYDGADPEQNMWNDGMVGRIDGPYGSSHDGSKYIVAICDTCIPKLVDGNRLEYRGEYF